MTRDDIIRIAREVWSAGDVYIGPSTEPLERFAALVAAAEREACAKVCDKIEKTKWETVMHGGETKSEGEQALRALVRTYRERGLSLRAIANVLAEQGIRSRVSAEDCAAAIRARAQ